MSGAISAIAALLSIPLSILAVVLGLRVQRYALQSATIRDWYSSMNELSNLRITVWQISHLIELPDSYWREVARLKSAFASLSLEELKKYEILERAVAVRIFEIFEQTIYELRLASGTKDRKKVEFLGEVKQYLTGRLLRNPRLLYLWSPSGGDLGTYFEPYTHEVYDREVASDPRTGLDPVGPYQIVKAESGE
jgi:hypothetical protein